MTEPAAGVWRWWKILLVALVAAMTCVALGLWYTTTQSFQNYVRSRMVSEVERITGGRAEVGSFHVVPFRLQVEVRNITVHGTEAPNEIPLAHADSFVAQLKVISFLRTEFGFYSVALEHPVVHVAIGPDGATTNIPALRGMGEAQRTTAELERLFSLSIDHLSVHNGELLWADQQIPLNFSVEGANVVMDYSFLRGRYESQLALGKVDTTLQDFRPFSWMTTIDFSLAPTFADIKSLQWSSGRSSLEATGRVSDFHNPRIDGNYDAQLNLGEAAAIARRKDLREGTAEFKGNGHWSLSDFTTTGSMALRDIGWQTDQFVLKKASGSADYFLNQDQLKVQKLQGKILSGSFAGDAVVDNWLHSAPLSQAEKGKKEELPTIGVARPVRKGEKAKMPSVQSGAVHLRLRDVSVAEAGAALDVPAHPLDGFKPAGLASGSVDALWKGTPAQCRDRI